MCAIIPKVLVEEIYILLIQANKWGELTLPATSVDVQQFSAQDYSHEKKHTLGCHIPFKGKCYLLSYVHENFNQWRKSINSVEEVNHIWRLSEENL